MTVTAKEAIVKDHIVIRRSSETDRSAVQRLALLDDRRPPKGDALLAFVDDELRAAVSLERAHAVADPFHATADVVELLRVRAAQEREAA